MNLWIKKIAHASIYGLVLFLTFIAYSVPSIAKPPPKAERIPWGIQKKGKPPAYKKSDWRPNYRIPTGWYPRYFYYETRYMVIDSLYGPILETFADGTASWLARPLKYRFNKSSPSCINWIWSADQLPALTAPEISIKGDDFALRLYVFGQLKNGKKYGFNYVWSQDHQKGEIWKSPYSNNKLMSLRSGANISGALVYESRDLTADLQRAIGMRPATITGIAIMTDSEASNSTARGRIGQINIGACALVS